MKILLADSNLHKRFAPLTLSRPVGNLRMGILTNDERWKTFIPQAEIFFKTEEYLQTKFPTSTSVDFHANAAVIPTKSLAEKALNLTSGQALVQGELVLIQRGETIAERIEFLEELVILEHIWDLFQLNEIVLKADFELLTKGRKSAELSRTNTVIGNPAHIFLEEGASCEANIINTLGGPIYIGKNAEVMEGSMLRGPFALCESAGVKMGAKIYGATTIGPHCKVGGEISNVIFQAYSNKGHDGFLGNSVLGEWCNLGADTNSSNLKNNYSKVSAYSFETGNIEKTDVQFMGLIMGDHSKSGINTMFNTATMVGFSANIYGGDFPEKYIPSYSWGSASGMVPFQKDKAIDVAKAMMGRRKVEFTDGDQAIFDALFVEM